MRYRVTVDAAIEARTNRDALRLMGEKLLAEAEHDPWPADGRLSDLSPTNYWIQVVPEE